MNFKKREYLCLGLILFVFSTHIVFCQTQRFSDSDGETWYGGGVLATQSGISGIYDMLVDGTIFQPTPHEERMVNAIGGVFWTRFGAPYSDFFIEGQFSFLSFIKPKNQLDGGHFQLMNEEGLEYNILFDYDHVSFGVFPGWFIPFKDRDESTFACYLTCGLTWTIASGTSIDYQSNESQFDLGVEKALENGFKFRNDFLFVPGAGIQIKPDDVWAIELRYSQAWGLVDIIETQDNPYFWREQDNQTRISHQVALTFLIRFDN